MKCQIDNVPEDVWGAFKKLCAEKNVTMRQKVIDLVTREVDRYQALEKKRAAKKTSAKKKKRA